MKLNTVLHGVFSKLGIDISSSEAQALLNNAQLANIEVADSVANGLSTDFFTKESAMSNPEIRNAIRAEAFNGIDSVTKELMSKYELPEDTQAEILKEEKSSKKYGKLVETIEKLTRQKSKASGADQDTLNKEISKLNEKIVGLRTEYEANLDNEKKGRKLDRINWELDGIYNGLDYALPSEKGISTTAAKAVMGQILQSRGLKFETTENGIQLLTKDGTEHFENNVKISPSDFIKRSLLENKLIKVSESRSETTQATPLQRGKTPQPRMNNSFDNAIDDLIRTNTQ